MLYRLATDHEFRFFSAGLYTQDELRTAIEAIAAGRPWGCRPEAGGTSVMEAVCDYTVIAKAVAAE